MTTRYYEQYKFKYETTKPIRGRAEDVRPIGERRRDWERVVKEDRADGTWYGARLYRTNVVMYGPNGEIELRSDGWATPSTAAFMTAHGPFTVFKDKRNLWVSRRGETHMIPKNEPLIAQTKSIMLDGEKILGYTYEIKTKVQLRQRVVNRSAAAAMRKRIKPFIDFSTTMLKLSDGWLMDATLRPYEINKQGAWYAQYDFGFGGSHPIRESTTEKEQILTVLCGAMPSTDKEIHKWISDNFKDIWDNAIERTLDILEKGDTDLWQRAMYQMLVRIEPVEERLVRTEIIDIPMPRGGVHQITRKYFDSRYTVDQLVRRINKIITAHSSTRAERMVEGNKVRKGLLG